MLRRPPKSSLDRSSAASDVYKRQFIDYFVREDGSILSYDPKEYNLDNVNAGKTLFDLYKLTGKAKYRKAMDTVYSQLQGQPRTSTGNFWHKLIYPNQIWLDGLYMAPVSYTHLTLPTHDLV